MAYRAPALLGNGGGSGRNTTRLLEQNRPARVTNLSNNNSTRSTTNRNLAPMDVNRTNTSRNNVNSGYPLGVTNQLVQQRGDALGNNAPPVYRPPEATGQASQATTTDWIDNLRSNVGSGGGSPDLGAVDSSVDRLRNQLTSGSPDMPGQVNIDNYHTQMATINDIANKFGFDYSREYAEQQAETVAQAQRDEIAAARERQQYETESAQENLGHDFFNQYLTQRQNLADTGLNAGIAAERDTRLEMNRQHAMADILANNQLSQQEMDRRLATIAQEEAAYADELYNERLQQGFGNAMDVSQFAQSENQWQAQMAMQQRNQRAEEQWREYEFNNMSAAQREQFLQSERQMGYENAWREHEFNNMSASERAKLVADAEQFGMEMAWQRHKFDAGLQHDASMAQAEAGFSSGGARQGALSTAEQFGLRMTSAQRSAAENKRVGGHPNSSHLTDRAMDFAGSEADMDRFANWAKNSGLYKNVLWKVPGHYDHVHVDW